MLCGIFYARKMVEMGIGWREGEGLWLDMIVESKNWKYMLIQRQLNFRISCGGTFGRGVVVMWIGEIRMR
jgi:hypothetical protein